MHVRQKLQVARMALPILAVASFLAINTYACGSDLPPSCTESAFKKAAEAACEESRDCQPGWEPECVSGPMNMVEGPTGECQASCRTCVCIPSDGVPHDNEIESDTPEWM